MSTDESSNPEAGQLNISSEPPSNDLNSESSKYQKGDASGAATMATTHPAASVADNDDIRGDSDNGNVNDNDRTQNASHFDAGSGVLSEGPPQRPSRRAFPQKSRTDMAQSWKEREERVRRIKEQQEEERRIKAEEWKQQALAAQKHREQMEQERKKQLHQVRVREQEKRHQIEERRRALELADRERRDALMKKNLEREERLEHRRKSHAATINFAFGSSTPRMVEPRPDDGARRSTSSTNVHANLMTQSMYVRRSTERETATDGGRLRSSSSKKSSSVFGLDKSGTEGSTREDAHSSRLSPGDPKVVHRRSGGGARKPRPVSIAVSGMTQSMYEKKSSPMTTGASTPTNQKSTASRFGGSDTKRKPHDKDDDAKSTSSSTSSKAKRTTPAQVKAKSAAKRGNLKTPTKETVPTPVLDAEEDKPREVTPDIISDSDKPPVSEPVKDLDVCENTDNSVESDKPQVEEERKLNEDDESAQMTPSGKKIITSEEEAKAKLAEKRRQMKEKMEREAELERQRLAEIEHQEEERRRKEEEEERLAMQEAERVAAEARKVEEERLQKAIAEAQVREEEERQRKAEEERVRKEQEEKAKEEAERRAAELEEKCRKEEEERLARKKRLEEIMARTRGKNTPTKKPEEPSEPHPPVSSIDQEEAESSSNGHVKEAEDINGMTKLETENNLINSELIKPDLLNDTNEKNQMKSLDDFDPFGPNISSSKASVTKESEETGELRGTETSQPVFDQILDLSGETTKTNADSSVMIGAPIIAFEDANGSSTTAQEVPTGDLLS